jgi:molybdopterin synthase catalytic subunit
MGLRKEFCGFSDLGQERPNRKSSDVKEATMIQINSDPISPQKMLGNLKTSNAGSMVIHVGVVRPFSEGKKVASIEYQADLQMAERELLSLGSEIQEKWEIEDLALCRRTGELNFGEVILVAAVAAPRHKAAFEACLFAVEKMKHMASITKRELFAEENAPARNIGASILPGSRA